MNNLADDKKRRKELAIMQGAVNEWLAKTNDVFPGIDKLKKDGIDRLSGTPLPKEK